jgi:uncharacterized protein YdeI (YjbR/CyaY-like superfamily)
VLFRTTIQCSGKTATGIQVPDHVLQVEGAKTDETRQRRIDKSIGILREGRAR